jgi:FimV-like protein
MTIITSQDIKAIAGENVFNTQLDLARAYIEMDKLKLAKNILNHVLERGNSAQQTLAEQMLQAIE